MFYRAFRKFLEFFFFAYLGDMAITALKNLNYATVGDLYAATAMYTSYMALIAIGKHIHRNKGG